MKWTSALVFCAVLNGTVAECWGESESTKTVYTNRRQFAIPFQFDSSELQRLGTTEVRLYVSVDQGGTWQQVQSVAPRTRRFFVRAPQDGIYWFAVRTVGRNQQEHPSGNRISPELKVVVDSVSPTFRIQLSEPAPGKVQLRWSTSGKDVDASTLHLESLQSGRTKWSKVYVAKKANGVTVWRIPRGGVVEVRGRIADRAGNVATAHDSVNIGVARPIVPRQKAPDFSQPIASAITIKKQTTLPDKFPPALERSKPSLLSPDSTTDGPRIQPKSQNSLSVDSEEGFITIKKRRPTPRFGVPTPVESVSTQDVTPVREPAVQEPPVPIRIVNRRQFQIGYQVEKVGSSGVQSVELFITQNNGKKWYRYGTDDDRRSPFNVVVPNDGKYGFIIRVKSGAGLSKPAPQPGDRPSLEVVVDRTAPGLKLLPILQGTGKDTNRFLIRWSSTDANPEEKPISISYAARPNGPWMEIVSRTANTGRFLWTVGQNVPPRVYIRLSARDKAGNISQLQTTRPIIVDLVRPSAKITEVQPIQSAGDRQ
ncbi:MAG: hypothetical protein Tsb009_06870 [Planctomycetaceae bacterium]